ncbi:MAG TPA: hypothetical protein VGC79_18445 [Polyangiaceae bacterium]
MKPEFPRTTIEAQLRLLGMFARCAVYVLLVVSLTLYAAYALLFKDDGALAVVLLWVIYNAHKLLAPTRDDFETMDDLMNFIQSRRGNDA